MGRNSAELPKAITPGSKEENGNAMTDFQSIKKLVGQYYRELDTAVPEDAGRVISRYAAKGYTWRGMHPFNELDGADAVGEVFWAPFLKSMAPIQRRPDIFMAGWNDIEPVGGEWVCSMGHLLGLFDHSWLGIPPTGKMTFLRYVEFHQVEAGQIKQTALFLDLPGVMRQAGLQPFPVETGAWFLTPGPRTHDGLLHGPQDPEESRKTMNLINRMIDDLVGSGLESPQAELAETLEPGHDLVRPDGDWCRLHVAPLPGAAPGSVQGRAG